MTSVSIQPLACPATLIICFTKQIHSRLFARATLNAPNIANSNGTGHQSYFFYPQLHNTLQRRRISSRRRLIGLVIGSGVLALRDSSNKAIPHVTWHPSSHPHDLASSTEISHRRYRSLIADSKIRLLSFGISRSTWPT